MTAKAPRKRVTSILATFLLTAALVMLPAVPATAATVGTMYDGQYLTYTAGAGEANSVTVTMVGSNVVIAETGPVTVTPGTGCSVSLRTATCPAPPAGFYLITIDTGDQNDAVSVPASVPATAATNGIYVYGGEGNDTLSMQSMAPGRLMGGGGDDTLSSGDTGHLLYGGPGDDTLSGGGGKDDLMGEAGQDDLYGGAGNDNLDPGLGLADAVSGGAHKDRVSYYRSAPVTVTLNGQADDGEVGEIDNVASDVEVVTGGQRNDTLVGSSARNWLYGGDGNDTISGGGGNDRLFGEFGDNTLNGGDGDDILEGAPAYGGYITNDTLNGGNGDDILRGDASSSEVFIGGAGEDFVPFVRDEPVTIKLDDVANDGEMGEGDNVRSDVENVETGIGNDVIVGSTAANDFVTGDGADTVSGGGGNDGLTGGRGRDKLNGGAGVDALLGQGGVDYIVSQDTYKDYVACGASIDTVDRDSNDQVMVDCETLK